MLKMWRESCSDSDVPAGRVLKLSGRQIGGIGWVTRSRTWLFPRLSILVYGIVVIPLLAILTHGQQAEAAIALTQLTSSSSNDSYDPSINADGTRIAFESENNLTGGNPDANREIFLWAEGSGITQLTSTTVGSSAGSSINTDGTRIVFFSSADLTGGNLDGNQEIFLWISGAGFFQITNTFGGGHSYYPTINADGSRITFYSTADPIGSNADGNSEIFLWTQGSGISQLTNTFFGGDSDYPSISFDGIRIVFSSSADLTGGNPDGNREIFLWAEGSGIAQLTSTVGGDSVTPSINTDGTRIAFSSDRDLTGYNSDGNHEIFLWAEGSGMTQLTNTTWVGFPSPFMLGNYSPSINADGSLIAFFSTRDLTGGNADSSFEIFASIVGSGIVQLSSATGGESFSPSINADGTRITFYSDADLTGGNADGNSEIFMISDTFSALSDLTGTWKPVSQHCDGGQCKLKGSVRIVNQGIATASASRLRVLLSDNAVLDLNDVIVKELRIKKLKSGRSKKSKVKISLPPGVNASGKYLFAVIDPLNRVTESAETNNALRYGPM